MHFAHLDAFMADTVRAICKARPDVLKSGRKLDWEAIVSSGGWEGLMTRLADQYAYEFGWESVTERLKVMQERLGLTLACPREHTRLLEEAELTRHVVVHNGGRVSQQYIQRTGCTDLRIGQFVPVTPTYVAQVARCAWSVAGALCVAVARAYCGVEHAYGVPLPGLREAEP
jgi:hypothetical protein